MKKLQILMVFLLAFLLNSSTILFGGSSLEFFYQQVLDVKTDPPPPANPSILDQLKSIGKTITNGIEVAKGVYDFRLNPTVGERILRSPTDPKITYRIKCVKVTDEKQLLELMGAKGDESKLTNGQKGLLAAYRFSTSKAIKDRLAISTRSVIPTVLTDTTGFEDPQKFSNLERDFWPMSMGSTIQLSSRCMSVPNYDLEGKTTLVHELSHTLDKNIPLGLLREVIHNHFTDGTLIYGKDMMHYQNEVTTPRASFMEGWAEFNEALEFPEERNQMFSETKKLFKEDPKTGEKKYYEATDPELSATDLLNCEGVITVILCRVASETTDGRKKVFDAFLASNSSNHTLKSFFKKFIAQHPGDLEKVKKILNEETHGKLSEKELSDLLGITQAQASTPVPTPTPAPTPIPTKTALNSAETPNSPTVSGPVKVNSPKTFGK
ncbi:MAG: hypothetical protein HQM08_10955 [Candidatus Riflebacteria bacterium]|nr:hypothetical protein [Candidatus Riflebacteria bacterium]